MERALVATIPYCPAPRALSLMPNLTLLAVSPLAIRKRPSIGGLIGENLDTRAVGVLRAILDDRDLQHSIAQRDVLGLTTITESVLKTPEHPVIGKYRTTISYFVSSGKLFSDAISMPAGAEDVCGYWPIYADDVVKDA